MARLTLEFDLDNPDDALRFKSVNKAQQMSGVLFELIHNFRKNTERLIEYKSEKEELLPLTVHDLIMKELFELIDEHDIHESDVY